VRNEQSTLQSLMQLRRELFKRRCLPHHFIAYAGQTLNEGRDLYARVD
jgi:hypothetical protein